MLALNRPSPKAIVLRVMPPTHHETVREEPAMDAIVESSAPGMLSMELWRALNGEPWAHDTADYRTRERIHRECQELVRNAYAHRDRRALARLHGALARIYERD